MQKGANNDNLNISCRPEKDLFLSWIGLTLIFCFNPLYVLIFLVLFERWIRMPLSIGYFFVFSFSLMFVNRDIGNSWSSGDSFANDDVINYLDFYHHIFEMQYFEDLGMTIFNGGEPLWFLIAGIVSFVTHGDDLAIIFVSVALPLLLLFQVFSSISRDFCFNAFFFFTLYPEINHLIYHVWRYSLSLSISLFLFIWVLRSQSVSKKLVFMSFAAHVSSILSLLTIAYGSILGNPFLEKRILNRFFVSLSFILVVSGILILAFYSVDYLEIEKFVFYVKSEDIMTPFTYSKRHILYLIISAYILSFSERRVSFVLSLLGFLLLILPYFLSVSIIYERLLQLIIPMIVVGFLYEIRFFLRFKVLLLIVIIPLAFDLWSNLQGELFYVYMSNGHNFHLLNGIGYNLIDLVTKIFMTE
jgi:hypothetical protein